MAASPVKARVIFIHRNGDKHDKGLRMVLHPIKMRDFEQLKTEVTAKVRLTTGAVRRIYSSDGTEVTHLDEFLDDGHYICCGGEKLKLDTLGLAAGASPKKASPTPKTVFSSPSSVDPPELGKPIEVFRNGDPHHAGAKIVIHSKRYKKFDQLLTDLSIKVGVSTGAVRRLYTAEGEEIKELDQLVAHAKYICTGSEKFDRAHIPKGVKDSSSSSSSPSRATPSPKKVIQKFGLQEEKGRLVWVYVNGDKHHKGEKFLIHPKKFKTMDQVRVLMTQRLTLPTGPVLKVYHYAPGGAIEEIKDLAQFVDQSHYVACGAEKFNRTAVPKVLLDLPLDASSTPLASGGGSSSSGRVAAHIEDDHEEPALGHVPAAATIPEPAAVPVVVAAPAPVVHEEPAVVPEVTAPAVEEASPAAAVEDDDTF